MQRTSERKYGSDIRIERAASMACAALSLALLSATASAESRIVAPSAAAALTDVDGLFDFFPEWAPLGLVGEFGVGTRGGDSVAMSGDTVAFGAPNAGGNGQGQVQIWRRGLGGWQFEQSFDFAQAGAHFGAAVDISGDWLIVGAPGYDFDSFDVDIGRAYIYHRDGTAWSIAATLDLEYGASADAPSFGTAVAISGKDALVGAPFAANGPSEAPGFAAFYRWDGIAWNYLIGAVGDDDGEQFGAAVDIIDRANFGGDIDDVAVIGAPGRDLDSGPFVAGGADVFSLSVGGVLDFEQTLPYPEPTTFGAFGASVSIAMPLTGGSHIAVGAPGRASHGSVLIYDRSGSNWVSGQELSPVDGETFDRFGGAVALSGGRIIVGSDGDDVDGDVGAVTDAGSVYFFREISGLWFRNDQEMLRSQHTGDRFGRSVAISGNYAVAGSGFVDGGGVDSGLVQAFVVDSIFASGFN